MGGGESVTDFFCSLWPDLPQLITTGIHHAIYSVWLYGCAGITDTRRKIHIVRRLPRNIYMSVSMYTYDPAPATPPRPSRPAGAVTQQEGGWSYALTHQRIHQLPPKFVKNITSLLCHNPPLLST